MKPFTTPILLLAICLIMACGRSNQSITATAVDTTMKKTDTTVYASENAAKIDTSDVSFFQSAAYGGMVEVESSGKILQSSKDKNVIAFAEMMTKDHNSVNKKLAELAKRKGYILPISLPPSKISVVDKISTLKQEAQNEYYVKLMVQEHDKAISIFSLASRSLDANIADFAKQTLPALNQHYKVVRQLDSALAVPKANQGDDPLKISNRNAKH